MDESEAKAKVRSSAVKAEVELDGEKDRYLLVGVWLVVRGFGGREV